MSSFRIRALIRPTDTSHAGRPIRGLPTVLENIPRNAPTDKLFEKVSIQTGLNTNRLRMTKGIDSTVIAAGDDRTVADWGLMDMSVINVKDLGR